MPGDGRAERMFLYSNNFAKIIVDFVSNHKFEKYKGDFIVSWEKSQSMTISKLENYISKKIYNMEKLKFPIKDTIFSNLDIIIDWFIDNYKFCKRK